MVDAPDVSDDDVQDYVQRLDLKKGEAVQEIGWDEDSGTALSEAIEDHLGEPLIEEDAEELCDVVLLWWRHDDGDLVDGLVDQVRNLADNGRVWLLTPGAGRPGTIEPGVIAESAQLAGLVQTKAERLGNWQGSCLVQRGFTRK